MASTPRRPNSAWAADVARIVERAPELTDRQIARLSSIFDASNKHAPQRKKKDHDVA